MKKKLYSYIRWSSAVQGRDGGTTQERQLESAEKYALEHGYELVTMIDAGVSAFRGKNVIREQKAEIEKKTNVKVGELGRFIDAVEEGLIPAGSILYCEGLDRLSRSNITTANSLFLQLLTLDIQIVTGMDGKSYTKESVNENPTDFLISTLMFVRANEESSTKQKRTYGNAEALIKRFKTGLPTTIKSVGSHPLWIDASTAYDEQVRKHPQYWQVAQYAMELFLEGASAFKVCKELNTRFPEGWKGKMWSVPNVRKLRTNPAVYGLRILSVRGIEYKLEGYYPPLITEAEFARLQDIQQNNKYITTGEKNQINLMAGLRLFRCGHCGSTMMAMRHKDTIRYLCEKGRAAGNLKSKDDKLKKLKGCRTWSLSGDLVEHTLMYAVTYAFIYKNKDNKEKVDYETQINETKDKILSITSRITNLTELVSAGLSNVAEVVESIKKLNEERQVLNLHLDKLQQNNLLQESSHFEELMMNYFETIQWPIIETVDHPERVKIREIVRSTIDKAVVWKADKKITIYYVTKDGTDFTFEAGDEKDTWRFYFGVPDLVKRSDEFEQAKQALEMNNELFDKILALKNQEAEAAGNALKTVIKSLQVVGYPEIDGKLFWPRK
ncbi:recombinase family protein [Pantoea sp. ACRSB]|uniref:recombinase family protein n=1 Tax=Pantoea sp. ACRSB TaxID=2918207 RepID=UPI0028937BF6|nr:recombinase family protein [Pantoea sp. ACRSB]MCG7387332.1 recombinase family protein [Pantoea sp. ACRSB]